ncbi:hypothetical protein GALMADRAFT_410088 [Galerina marginata CBS 339.88]|uniref:DUF6534 domain-containing protein n=1 Tax=Galerina marginata (strain CBS 339.88) TaxID=685588 RepID=A0A067T397_GALM3|nr:hypothetical protein GALMADRAFT_410088 [Galerina marginata CBS 339.88]
MQVTLGNTIGAGLLGCTAAAVLFGVAIVQAYIYYTHYPKDWVFQKVIVGFLLLVDTVHTGMTTHTVYYYVIEQFGNVFALEFVVWSFKLQVVFNVFILLLVQTLYVMRIWKLASHFSRVWPAIIIAILVGGYAIGFLLAFHSFRLKSWDGLDGMASVVKASFSCSTGIDIILAASMCYYLNRSKTSFVGTNNRIVAVIHYVLISGSLTSATSLAILLCFLAMPNNLIFISITFIVTKVYINSYLAM